MNRFGMMKLVMVENVGGGTSFWMKVSLDDFCFGRNLDETVPHLF